MTYCSSCGKNNTDTAKFCGKCGTKLVKSDVKLAEDVEGLVPATSNKRLLNMFIDMFAMIPLYIVVSIVLVFFGYESSEESGTYQLWTYISMVFYYYIMEKSFGKTVGKFITRTRVVSADGRNELTAKQVFIRSISRLVPFEIFSFSGSNPIGWHDKWAKTMVINDN